jgi:hypothetical protein
MHHEADNRRTLLGAGYGSIILCLRNNRPHVFGRRASVDFRLAVCDACGEATPCLCADGSDGEYAPVCLCRACIEGAFMELAGISLS